MRQAGGETVTGRAGPRRIVGGAAALASCLAAPSRALAQCAMCGTAVGSSGFARGFAISVLFLLSTLLLVVLAFVGLVLTRARSRDARPDAATPVAPAAPAVSRWRSLPRPPAS